MKTVNPATRNRQPGIWYPKLVYITTRTEIGHARTELKCSVQESLYPRTKDLCMWLVSKTKSSWYLFTASSCSLVYSSACVVFGTPFLSLSSAPLLGTSLVLLSSGALEDVARRFRNSEEQLNGWDETLSQWVPCTVISLAKKVVLHGDQTSRKNGQLGPDLE